MKSHHRALRRVLALAGAAIIGSFAAVAIPSPASAHHPIVDATCVIGGDGWTVNWTVANSESDLEGKLIAVTVTPAANAVAGIGLDATLPVSSAGPLTGVQTLSDDDESATLSVTAFWQRGSHEIKQSAEKTITKQSCKTERIVKPTATFTPNCDGSVVVELFNGEGANGPAYFTVSGYEGRVRVMPRSSAKVTIAPADADAIDVTVSRQVIASGAYTYDAACAPMRTVKMTCDSLSVEVSNPDQGIAVEGVLTPSTGDAKAFTLKAGEKHPETFPATDGFNVAMKVSGLDDETVAWAKPASCAPALPNTGSNLTTVVASGAAFVVLGVAILFFFRRRRGAHARF